MLARLPSGATGHRLRSLHDRRRREAAGEPQVPVGPGRASTRLAEPGERVRAALICLFQRRPAVELLVLDEPTDDLDLLAISALEATLRAWPGGLLIASHDAEFLRAVSAALSAAHCLELERRAEHLD